MVADLQTLAETYVNTRDPLVRDLIAEKSQGLARNTAKRFLPDYPVPGTEFDDLVQVANLGLIEAIDEYCLDRGTEFKSFVLTKMRHRVRNVLDSSTVPRRIAEVARDLSQRDFPPETIRDVVALRGKRYHIEGMAYAILRQLSGNARDISLFYQNEEGRAGRARDFIQDEPGPSEQAASKDLVDSMLSSFSNQHRRILELHLFEKFTFGEIGNRMKLTPVQIRTMYRNHIVPRLSREYRRLSRDWDEHVVTVAPLEDRIREYRHVERLSTRVIAEKVGLSQKGVEQILSRMA